jgi:serine/threonine-protein kinase
VRSIAVLPFANVSGEPQDEYLSDGITEELINALAQFGELRVAARTSSFALKGASIDVGAAATTLGVDAVLEGSVRRAGTQLRISTQLINAVDGYPIWSERYDCDTGNVFAIQDEITQAIVRRLKLSLAASRDAVAKPPTTDIGAYHLYLKGRHLWNKRSKASLEQAVKYFTEAIERDPRFALAYAGIADTHLLCAAYNFTVPSVAMPKVEEAVGRALELDGLLAEAHTTRGQVLRWKRDWHGEEDAYRQAIALNPNYPTAHQWFATHLAARGRFEEALAEIRLAQELDPLSHAISVTVAVVLFYAREYEAAIEQLHRTLELEPNFASVHAWLGILFAQTGRHDEASREVERARELAPDNPNVLIGLAYSHAVQGQRAQALEILHTLQEHGLITWGAMVHSALGEHDEAFDALRRSLDAPDASESLYYLKVFPWVDPLRSDPRFGEILTRLKIPD